jgi:DNA-binding NtrC family response regulator
MTENKRILVVEDDVDWREEIAGVLSEYEVIQASSIAEACRLIDGADQANRPIDLVILDLWLSEAAGIDSGLAVLAHLKDRVPKVPCIVFTARELSLSRAAMLFQKYNIFAGLEKPEDMHRLAKVVRSGLAQAKDQQSIKSSEESVPETAIVRELLTAAFSDEELTALCFDCFRPVYDALTVEMNKWHKIQLLLDYCDRHQMVKELLSMVRERNPTQYERFRARLR